MGKWLKVRFQSTIGAFEVPVYDYESNTDVPFYFGAPELPVIEGSMPITPNDYGATFGNAGTFYLIGKSGAKYRLAPVTNVLYRWFYTESGGNFTNVYRVSTSTPPTTIEVAYIARRKQTDGTYRYALNIVGLSTSTYGSCAAIAISSASIGRNGYYVGEYKSTYRLSQDPVYFTAGNDAHNMMVDLFNNSTIVDPNPDPYEPGDESGTGGGEGDFDDTSDDIDIPPLPTIGATNTGFITLFNPTLSQLQALANYMWANPLFDLSQWRRIFAEPMQAILGLSIVPVAVPDGGLLEVTVGNIPTGITMPQAGAQYVTVDCGTLNINEYWGAYLDYDPFTKAEIYLPYCGIHPLSVDDIMGKAVHVVYHIDILSGACCAYVKCGGSVLYSFVGQCASSIPITGADFTSVINGILSIAGSVGSMVATGGMSAPMAVANTASTVVNAFKPSVERSGSMGGTGGLMAIQKPYIVLTRPRQALPAQQNKYTGYPSFITVNLGELEGYTEVESVHLENIPATGAELSELETILKTGAIF